MRGILYLFLSTFMLLSGCSLRDSNTVDRGLQNYLFPTANYECHDFLGDRIVDFQLSIETQLFPVERTTSRYVSSATLLNSQINDTTAKISAFIVFRSESFSQAPETFDNRSPTLAGGIVVSKDLITSAEMGADFSAYSLSVIETWNYLSEDYSLSFSLNGIFTALVGFDGVGNAVDGGVSWELSNLAWENTGLLIQTRQSDGALMGMRKVMCRLKVD